MATQADGRAETALEPRGVDHVELYVGNARQAVAYYRSLGFREVGFTGLETGDRERASHYLKSGDVRLVIRASLTGDDVVAEQVKRRGDHVHSLGLTVDDAAAAYDEALRRGAQGLAEPQTEATADRSLTWATIAGAGVIDHTLVAREGCGDGVPGLLQVDDGTAATREKPSELVAVDHVALAIPYGTLRRVQAFYEQVLQFTELEQSALDSVETDCSALMSRVVQDGGGRIKFPLIEPEPGPRKSQIQEFLDFNAGAGVQHLAFEVEDIVAVADQMRAGDIGFLSIPEGYYDGVADRVPEVASRLPGLSANGVLVDRDEDGYLLQTFSTPLGDRPTLFVELIERHGAKGFGGGNVQQLFAALEDAQAARGNL